MIGNRLKELRKKKGLTQSELAVILEVGQSVVASYERNDTFVSVDKLLVLSELFDVSMDYLTGKSDIPHTQAEADFMKEVQEKGLGYMVQRYNESLPLEERMSEKEQRILTNIITEFLED